MTAFSQRDPRWAAEPLGWSKLSLSQAGCLVSAVASLLASWGHVWTPQTLNVFLRQSHGYVDDCLFLFAGIDGLGARFTEFIDCYRTPAPVDRLAAALAGGAGVLAMVDWAPGGAVQPHWVRITELAALRGKIMDPWQMPGKEQTELSIYLAPGWLPSRGIFVAAVYSPVDLRQRATWRSVAGQQPTVCVRAVDDRHGD